MKNILTIGRGFVAQHLPYKIIEQKFTINQNEISDFLDHYEPNVIVNTIGHCGNPNIDSCQIEKVKTFETNVALPLLFATECHRRNIQFIHIGSGCIFCGESPSSNGWRETDVPNPASLYARSKYSCDLAIQDLENVCIFRIRMPISKLDHPRNYLNKIFKYTSILDCPNSVTFLDDLTRAVQWAVDNDKRGVYHLTSPLTVSAAEIVQLYRYFPNTPKFRYQIIGEDELSRLVTAPRSNCMIDNSKIINEGFPIENSSIQLPKYLLEYVTNKAHLTNSPHDL